MADENEETRQHGIEELAKLVRAYVVSAASNFMSIADLIKDHRDVGGKDLRADVVRLGFGSVEDFVEYLNNRGDYINTFINAGVLRLQAVSQQQTAHLEKLIEKQRQAPKLARFGGNGNSGAAASASSVASGRGSRSLSRGFGRGGGMGSSRGRSRGTGRSLSSAASGRGGHPAAMGAGAMSRSKTDYTSRGRASASTLQRGGRAAGSVVPTVRMVYENPNRNVASGSFGQAVSKSSQQPQLQNRAVSSFGVAASSPLAQFPRAGLSGFGQAAAQSSTWPRDTTQFTPQAVVGVPPIATAAADGSTGGAQRSGNFTAPQLHNVNSTLSAQQSIKPQSAQPAAASNTSDRPSDKFIQRILFFLKLPQNQRGLELPAFQQAYEQFYRLRDEIETTEIRFLADVANIHMLPLYCTDIQVASNTICVRSAQPAAASPSLVVNSDAPSNRECKAKPHGGLQISISNQDSARRSRVVAEAQESSLTGHRAFDGNLANVGGVYQSHVASNRSVVGGIGRGKASTQDGQRSAMSSSVTTIGVRPSVSPQLQQGRVHTNAFSPPSIIQGADVNAITPTFRSSGRSLPRTSPQVDASSRPSTANEVAVGHYFERPDDYNDEYDYVSDEEKEGLPLPKLWPVVYNPGMQIDREVKLKLTESIRRQLAYLLSQKPSGMDYKDLNEMYSKQFKSSINARQNFNCDYLYLLKCYDGDIFNLLPEGASWFLRPTKRLLDVLGIVLSQTSESDQSFASHSNESQHQAMPQNYPQFSANTTSYAAARAAIASPASLRSGAASRSNGRESTSFSSAANESFEDRFVRECHQILRKHPAGVTNYDFLDAYERAYGHTLNFDGFGSDVLSLADIADQRVGERAFTLVKFGNTYMLHLPSAAVGASESPSTASNVASLFSATQSQSASVVTSLGAASLQQPIAGGSEKDEMQRLYAIVSEQAGGMLLSDAIEKFRLLYGRSFPNSDRKTELNLALIRYPALFSIKYDRQGMMVMASSSAVSLLNHAAHATTASLGAPPPQRSAAVAAAGRSGIDIVSLLATHVLTKPNLSREDRLMSEQLVVDEAQRAAQMTQFRRSVAHLTITDIATPELKYEWSLPFDDAPSLLLDEDAILRRLFEASEQQAETIPVWVSCLYDTDDFYIIKHSDFNALIKLLTDLQDTYSTPTFNERLSIPPNSIVPNLPVAVLYENVWYRGLVLVEDAPQIYVQLVDFGVVVSVGLPQLRLIRQQFVTRHAAFAIRSRLTDVFIADPNVATVAETAMRSAVAGFMLYGEITWILGVAFPRGNYVFPDLIVSVCLCDTRTAEDKFIQDVLADHCRGAVVIQKDECFIRSFASSESFERFLEDRLADFNLDEEAETAANDVAEGVNVAYENGPDGLNAAEPVLDENFDDLPDLDSDAESESFLSPCVVETVADSNDFVQETNGFACDDSSWQNESLLVSADNPVAAVEADADASSNKPATSFVAEDLCISTDRPTHRTTQATAATPTMSAPFSVCVYPILARTFVAGDILESIACGASSRAELETFIEGLKHVQTILQRSLESGELSAAQKDDCLNRIQRAKFQLDQAESAFNTLQRQTLPSPTTRREAIGNAPLAKAKLPSAASSYALEYACSSIFTDSSCALDFISKSKVTSTEEKQGLKQPSRTFSASLNPNRAKKIVPAAVGLQPNSDAVASPCPREKRSSSDASSPAPSDPNSAHSSAHCEAEERATASLAISQPSATTTAAQKLLVTLSAKSQHRCVSTTSNVNGGTASPGKAITLVDAAKPPRAIATASVANTPAGSKLKPVRMVSPSTEMKLKVQAAAFGEEIQEELVPVRPTSRDSLGLSGAANSSSAPQLNPNAIPFFASASKLAQPRPQLVSFPTQTSQPQFVTQISSAQIPPQQFLVSSNFQHVAGLPLHYGQQAPQLHYAPMVAMQPNQMLPQQAPAQMFYLNLPQQQPLPVLQVPQAASGAGQLVVRPVFLLQQQQPPFPAYSGPN